MPSITELNQRHPTYNRDRIQDLCALYEGDALFAQRLPRFLIQREREPVARYHTRCQEYHYRNYIGPVIDYFTSMLFASRPAAVAKQDGKIVVDPGEYYGRFREDADRSGVDIDAVFKTRLTEAMVTGHSWVRVQHPDVKTAPESRADFERDGLGECWIESPDYDQVLDWDTDEYGRLLWVIVFKQTARRNGVSGSRDTITDQWEYITAETIETYAITYDRKKPPPPQTNVPLVKTQAHRFGRVPMVCLHLPPSLWVASRLRGPQLAHFRASNGQSWSLTSTCYAMPVAKVKDPAEFSKMLSGAGYGVIIGIDEDWAWDAPPAGHFAALDTEIKAHKDEIFRIANQMALGVSNNAASVGRSAESKTADLEATRVVLIAFSRLVKEKIESVYDLISSARGDDYEWSIEGLDDFAALDIGGLAEVLERVDKLGGIPSKTWNTAMKTRLAEALLPDMDQGTKVMVQREIKEGIAEAEERDDELVELARAAQQLRQIEQVTAHGTDDGRGAAPARQPGSGQARGNRGGASGVATGKPPQGSKRGS